MTAAWKLKRTSQCDKCPWRVDTNPRDIPNGYDEEKHAALRKTIATDPLGNLMAAQLHIMACHETHDAHCIGWLENQRGVGNNIALRIHLFSCENANKTRLRGKQHPNFDATLP